MEKENIDEMITRKQLLDQLMPGLNALFGIPDTRKKEIKMKTKSKAAQIRTMLMNGKQPKEIAERLRVSVNRVYNENWKLKNKPKKRIVLRQSEVDLAKKLAIPIEAYAKQKLKMQNETKKATPLADFVRKELATVERRISDMQTIASFLAIRLGQLEHNGE